MVASKFEPHDNWLPPCYRVPPELEQALIESGVPAAHWNMAEIMPLQLEKRGEGELSKEQICRAVQEGRNRNKKDGAEVRGIASYIRSALHCIGFLTKADPYWPNTRIYYSVYPFK